ncbi:Casein kinase I isoform delta-A [Mizuhopecten yessoensis]|uniref:non-specific serine/threonine protein kinase n=1 Tax=Mizuhopecten yessoensis TaxID=6573 RepID=A0A210PED2_MIZYE|nr:Casein kinase I isoform delta-A [Mizuhopecten yessoensis]
MIDRVVYSRDYSSYYAERESPAASSRHRDYVRDFGEENQGYLSNYRRDSKKIKIGTPIMVDLGNGTRKLEQIVANRYRLEKIIGKDYFGEIYLGTDLNNTGRQVAIKIEQAWRKHSYLRLEHKVYNVMKGGVGIPKVIWRGREGQYDIMVMELLGASLKDRLVTQSGKFCLRRVLFLAEAFINVFEYIHSKGFIYRDVKPHNFLTGSGDKENVIYVSNFRLSKRFRDAKTHEHIPYLTNKSFVGSLEYASINAQLGIQQSRRDDMESLGYVLVYFLRGTLPWLELRYETKKEKYALTLDEKMALSMEALCQGCPLEFFIYIRICRSMGFDEKPDYSRLRQLFRNVSKRYNLTSDETFGWKVKTTLGRDDRRSTSPSISPYIKGWLDKE